MDSSIRAGAIQLNSTEDFDANLRAADRLVRDAASRGSQLVVLPEKWTVLGRPEAMRAGAQALDGPAVTWAREIAAELGIDLVAGSFVEAREGQEKTSNTSVHVTPDGELAAVYRKLHMFDVEVDGVTYMESACEQAGDQVVLTTTGHGARRLGMSICYDLRFAELYRAHSQRGAELLAVAAAFTLATTRDHWPTLLRARAIENQAFVIASNQIGDHLPGTRSGGRSMIVDPWGIVLAAAPDEPCAIVADLDFERLARIRAKLPALSHRRPERLYSRPAGREDGETR